MKQLFHDGGKMSRGSLFGLALCLIFASGAFGQGAFLPTKSVNSQVNGVLRGVANATITVCAANASGIPCSPALSGATFRDQALMQPLANPTVSDANGNYPAIAMAAGTYTVTETAAGFTGFSYQVTISCLGGANNCTVTGSVTLNGATTLNAVGKFDGNCLVDGVQNATLAAAVTCAGTSGVIEIPMFAVPALTANVTIPVGVTLRFDGPSGITTTGFTLTVNGPLQAPATQIFFGTGTIVFGGLALPVNPAWFPGVDLGAQMVNAAAAIPSPGGQLVVSPGSYSIATGITLGTATKAITVSCQRGDYNNVGTTFIGPTTLTFTGSGTFITFNGQTHAGMNGCTLVGPDGTTGTTAVGLLVGGGTNNCIYCYFSDNDISGFGNGGVQFGNNVFVVNFDRDTIHDNGPGGSKNIVVPAGLTQFGENITFSGGSINNKSASFSTTCINLAAPGDYYFWNVSISQCGITSNSINNYVHMLSHVENPNGTTISPFFTFGASSNFSGLTVLGGEWLEDGTAGARTEFIKDTSTVANHYIEVNIEGGSFIPGETVAQLINFAGTTCCGRATVSSFINGFGGSAFTNAISASTTVGWNGTVGAMDCGTTASCAQTPLVGPLKFKMIKGSVALTSGTPSTATITNIFPAFASSTSYVCVVTNATTQANPLKVSNVSASSFTITGPNTVTDTATYICGGN